MEKKRISRRVFLKASGAGSAAILAITPGLSLAGETLTQEPKLDRHALYAALGDTLIPSDPGDPGYRTLEPYGITEEVLKDLTALQEADLDAFNHGAADFFEGRSFLQLTEPQRATYLRLIIDGSAFSDKTRLRMLQRIYRQARARVFTVFYRNYPENVIPRDRNGVPILRPGDPHQITNPNTKSLVTGWDIAGFGGPLSWQEEEERRAQLKKIDWQR